MNSGQWCGCFASPCMMTCTGEVVSVTPNSGAVVLRHRVYRWSFCWMTRRHCPICCRWTCTSLKTRWRTSWTRPSRRWAWRKCWRSSTPPGRRWSSSTSDIHELESLCCTPAKNLLRRSRITRFTAFYRFMSSARVIRQRVCASGQ